MVRMRAWERNGTRLPVIPTTIRLTGRLHFELDTRSGFDQQAAEVLRLNTPLESATRDHIAAAIAEIMSAAVAEIAENTAVIDQAKGMLILLYGVDDQTAFDTLRRHSQNTNIKLRALAEQLVSNYRALSNGRWKSSVA